MKYVAFLLAVLTASFAHAHSGAHLHPHDANNWLAVVLAAATVAGVFVLTHARGRK